MAAFDPRESRLVVRIVYDGPANAGKTTNVRQLCRFFTTMRRGELVTPEERAGRTLFFDWVHLDGGLVAGYPLRCQLVTVPGQAVLADRRRHVLTTADAVIFVCESTPDGVHIGERLLATLRDGGAAAGVPLVVQANKQDVPGALDSVALGARLGLNAAVPVVEARAQEGAGVRETLVLAIRAAADRAQAQVLKHGVDKLNQQPESSDDLLKALKGVSVVPAVSFAQSAMEVFPARPAVASATAPTDGAVLAARPKPAEALAAPAIAAESAPEAPPASGGTAPPVARGAAPTTPPDDSTSAALPAGKAADGSGSTDRMTRDEVAAVLDAGRKDGSSRSGDLPRLPSARVPLGFVWPATEGRKILSELVQDQAVLREDLVGRHGTSDGSGTSDAVILKCGDWCLKTSPRRSHADADAARAAMLYLAREKTRLGDLLPPRTVLCLQPSQDGLTWLWTVTPWLTTLRTWMGRADAAGDENSLEAALSTFAEAAVKALVLAVRQGLVLDVHPSNFGLADGRLVYVDDDVVKGRAVPAIGHVILRRFDEYARWPAALAEYRSMLISGLHKELTPEEQAQLALGAAFSDAMVTSEPAREAKAALIGALAKGA